jgi:predicted MFS family arabinose efflux permease
MDIAHYRLGRREYFSILAVAPLGYLVFYGLPYQVASLTSRFGLSESIAGWIPSAELLMVALVAVIAGRSIETRDKRLLAMVGVCVAAIGAVIAIVSDDLTIDVSAELIIGAGLGAVTAAGNALPALFSEPEKTYARIAMSMALMFAVLMYGVPAASSLIGPKAYEVVELAIIVILGSFALGVPRAKLPRQSRNGGMRSNRMPRSVVYVLIATFGLYVSQAISWTFSELAAQVVHLSASDMTTTFTVLALSQIPAAAIATRFGMRAGYRTPITIGMLLLIVGVLGVYELVSSWTYIPSIIIASAVGTFLFPYFQGLLAELDETGRSAAVGGAVINLGAAAGPAIGSLVYSQGGLLFIGFAAAGISVISLGLVLSALRFWKNAQRVAVA